jgi:hypothetical protein
MEIILPLKSDLIAELQVIRNLKEKHSEIMENSYTRFTSNLKFEDLMQEANLIRKRINEKKSIIAKLTNLN